MRDLEGAEREFRAATEKDALDGDFRFHLAQSLLLLRRAPQAEEEARILVAANNQDASYHKLLADSLYAQGKNEDALYEYRRSLEIKPVTADTREIENRIASIRETLGLR
jgi:tetratricopeptide (TPR) repeat protein